MTWNRRDFLQAGLSTSLIAALPKGAAAQHAFTPRPEAWRNFEMVTRVELAKGQGATQAWIPLPAFSEPEWTRPMGSTWQTNARVAVVERDPKYGAEMLHLSWDGSEAPMAEVTSRFATRDRAVDFAKVGTPAPLSADERKLYTGATELIPTDGIVKQTADMITARRAIRARESARHLRVDRRQHVPQPEGHAAAASAISLRCSRPATSAASAPISTRSMSDLRAPPACLPATSTASALRPSKFGYRSLGTGAGHHQGAALPRGGLSRSGFGWVPVDPADVRKVVLEEPPGNLPLSDAKVAAARRRCSAHGR